MIVVVDHDPAWATTFQLLQAWYAAALDEAGVPVVAIEHVGSTAVPSLAAKPLIDCDIIVRQDYVEAACAVLTRLGFEPLGELGIPQRWAFSAPEDQPRTNTYVIVDGCLALRNHRAVRDILRADPILREQYGAAKKLLGATAADIDEYGAGKSEILQRILESAGLSAVERATIASLQVPLAAEAAEQPL